MRADGAVGAAIDVARGFAVLATEALDAEALAPFTRQPPTPWWPARSARWATTSSSLFPADSAPG